MRFVAILLLFVVACRPSQNYHFDSIAELNRTVFHPGDSVFLEGGRTYTGNITIDSADAGTEANPVVITSSGVGKATINAGNGPGISLSNSQFIRIVNLHVKGSGRKNGNSSGGVGVVASRDVWVDSLSIEGFRSAGLVIEKSRRIVASRIHAFDNGFAGILAQGEQLSITDCLAENNPGDPTNLTNHSGNGILVGYSKNVIVDRCVATNNGWDMPRVGNGPVGIWAYESDSVLIQRCVSYRNRTSKGGDDGGGFDLDGGVTNSTIQYCLSYENEGSGFGLFQYDGAGLWKNNTVCYNVSINDGKASAAHAGIYVWNATGDGSQLSGARVFGNFIYNNAGAAMRLAPQSERMDFYYLGNTFVVREFPPGGSTADVFVLNYWKPL